MSFYKSIANYYDNIFPLNEKQIQLIKSHFGDLSNARVLDVGCGTGNLTLALSKLAKYVDGIDLDQEMLDRAVTKNRAEHVRFFDSNMLAFASEIQEAYNVIMCFGNTLVHLDSLDEIDQFLKQCKCRLTADGSIFLQIINYDRILSHQITSLPTIDNNYVKFVRNYAYLPGEHKIDFSTALTIKESNENEEITNSQLLYPLKHKELTYLLESNALEIVNTYGNFNLDAFDVDKSMHLIVVAKNA